MQQDVSYTCSPLILWNFTFNSFWWVCEWMLLLFIVKSVLFIKWLGMIVLINKTMHKLKEAWNNALISTAVKTAAYDTPTQKNKKKKVGVLSYLASLKMARDRLENERECHVRNRITPSSENVLCYSHSLVFQIYIGDQVWAAYSETEAKTAPLSHSSTLTCQSHHCLVGTSPRPRLRK